MGEAKHFLNNPECGETAEAKVSQNDNAYGVGWADVVREYLKKGYAGEDPECEVESFGKAYKVLKRDRVTDFLDGDGNMLFDVENERLRKEYEFLMEAPDDGETEEEQEAEDVREEPDEGPDGAGSGEKPGQEQEDGTEEPAPARAVIDRAVAKLEGELEEAKEDENAEPIIEYLIGRCRESESLAADVCQDHKTWEKCYAYISSLVKGMVKKRTGAVMLHVRDEVVYEWAEDYYHLDDKAEGKKKAKGKAGRQKKASDGKKLASQQAGTYRKKEKTEKKPEEPPKKLLKKQREAPDPRPKKNELEGQMDIFSLMGM